jgi:hypothetical protein
MKDLMVNCIGALVFSLLGLFYIKRRGKGNLIWKFVPRMKTNEEIEATNEWIKGTRERKKNKKKK